MAHVTDVCEPRRYSFVLPHPDQSRVLLLADEGGWTLPGVECAGDWFAEDVGELARLVRECHGVDVVVLKDWERDGRLIGELENRDPAWEPLSGACWAGPAELAAVRLADEALRPAIERWLMQAESGGLDSRPIPWERPGWFDEAAAWIADRAAALGLTLTGPVTQRKAAWDGSCILRAPSSGGDLWLKAVYHRPPAEPAVVELLAERWPANVPRVMAADHQRRWMLMADLGGDPLTGQPPHRWDGAVRLFSRIQIDSIDRLHRWRALGCPDMRPRTLPARLRAMLADTAALVEAENGLDAAEVARLAALLPRVESLCAELEDGPCAESMVQQDFRHDNLVITGDTYCYFDWSDTVIAHPFMSGNRFLDYLTPPEGADRLDWRLAYPADDERRRVRDAYLEPWTAYAAPEDLRRIFSLARRLNPLHQAARWYAERSYLDPETHWAAEVAATPAGYLKLFLRDQEAGA